MDKSCIVSLEHSGEVPGSSVVDSPERWMLVDSSEEDKPEADNQEPVAWADKRALVELVG